MSCKLEFQWKCGKGYVGFIWCPCHQVLFQDCKQGTTWLFPERLVNRENMPRRFKKDNVSVCWDLESLERMDHEVQIWMSRSTQQVERDVEMGFTEGRETRIKLWGKTAPVPAASSWASLHHSSTQSTFSYKPNPSGVRDTTRQSSHCLEYKFKMCRNV